MKRNTKIIISLTGIFIVTLMLLGLTYGYFITRIEGNSSSKSINVTTGNKSIVYTDLSKDVEGVITPGFTTVKPFTIENTGNMEADFSIYLVDVINNFNRTQDIVYTLYRKKELVESEITINTIFNENDGWNLPLDDAGIVKK